MAQGEYEYINFDAKMQIEDNRWQKRKLCFTTSLLALLIISAIVLFTVPTLLPSSMLHSACAEPTKQYGGKGKDNHMEGLALPDGTQKYEKKGTRGQSPNILILTMTYDESSWAKDWSTNRNRTADNFLDLISSQVDLSTVKLGFLTASEAVYNEMIIASRKRNIGHTVILYQKPTITYSYKDRHNWNIQYKRCANIATKRNILMFRTLQEEQHIIWLDADVVSFTPHLFENLIKHSTDRDGKAGIITARCDKQRAHTTAIDYNYDRNAWALDWSVDDIQSAIPEEQRGHVRDRWVRTRFEVPRVTSSLAENEMGRLDGVGATILYIQADLIRQGVSFPAFNIVGTTWRKDGWVGQETEGICYMAKYTTGTDCWTLAKSHHALHAY